MRTDAPVIGKQARLCQILYGPETENACLVLVSQTVSDMTSRIYNTASSWSHFLVKCG